jgi:Zn-dependent protease with chaperone function
VRLGEFVLPVLVATVAAMAAAALHRRVAPPIAAGVVLSTSSLLGLAVVIVAASWSASFIAHRSAIVDIAGWCRHVVGSHDTVPGWLGAAATVLVALGAIRSGRVLRAWRGFRRVDHRPIEVVRSDRLFAYTLPGPGRQIVASSALLCSLEPEQVDVVLAHERAHGHHRHDRYVLAGNLAVAFVPWLRPLQRRLEFALERWADDAAAAEIGGDRRLVAQTLSRVALSQASGPAGVLAFSRLGVVGRIDALSRAPVVPGMSGRVAAMSIGTVIVAAAAAVQLHHVGALLLALCWS